jgi:hypothetical protein
MGFCDAMKPFDLVLMNSVSGKQRDTDMESTGNFQPV